MFKMPVTNNDNEKKEKSTKDEHPYDILTSYSWIP